MLNPSDRAFVQHSKDLFDPALLKQLRARFAERGQFENNPNALSERERNAIARGESSDRFRMQDCWYDVWRKPVSLQELLERIRPYTYVTFPVQVRHVRQPTGQSVPWHQDTGYMSLLPQERKHKKVITCFIPLEDNPAGCTTIQFARHPDAGGAEMQHVALDGFGAGLPNDFKDVYHFDLALGDALVFGDMAPHRTFLPEGAQVDRRSLEFRLVEPKDALPNKDYFNIETGQFVKTGDTVRSMANA